MKWLKNYWNSKMYRYAFFFLAVFLPLYDLIIYIFYKTVQFGGSIIGGIVLFFFLLFSFLYRKSE